MSCPVMGVDPSYNGPLDRVYRAALALGTANQLTNILRCAAPSWLVGLVSCVACGLSALFNTACRLSLVA
jgi:hypothetical protein